MARLKVYADASALIGLGRIRRLDLLTLLPNPIYVTARVWEEAASNPAKPGVGALLEARNMGLLSVVEEGNSDAFPELDPGESTVLDAAAAAGAIVAIDERRARAMIDTNPRLKAAIRRPVGIIGLVLLAKRLGSVEAVRPLLDELIRQDFRISPTFYQNALREAGEL